MIRKGFIDGLQTWVWECEYCHKFIGTSVEIEPTCVFDDCILSKKDITHTIINNWGKNMESKIEHETIENPLYSFSTALLVMKKGIRVARKGWNGKDMYIYYVPANTYKSVTEIAKKEFGDYVPYGAYIAMKTVQGNVVPWLASQTDLLSDDWMLLDE